MAPDARVIAAAPGKESEVTVMYSKKKISPVSTGESTRHVSNCAQPRLKTLKRKVRIKIQCKKYGYQEY